MNIFYNAKEFLSIMERHEKFLDYLKSVSNEYNKIDIDYNKILGASSSQVAQEYSKLKTSINNTKNNIFKLVRTLRPSAMIDLINSLTSDLNLFDHSYNDENTFIIEIKKLCEIHTDAYSDKTAEHLFKFGYVCDKIYFHFMSLKERYIYIVDNMGNYTFKIPDSYGTLTISTDQDLPLIENFSETFKNIDDLYKILCKFHSIDYSNNRLIINHMSTGSWYLKLIGEKNVVKSMENILLGFGKFLRDIITGKIKLEKYENKCKQVKAYIEICEFAESKNIKNSHLGIDKVMKPLLENIAKDTTHFEVNGNEILDLRKHERLTVIENRTRRKDLIEQVHKIDMNKEIKDVDEKNNNGDE